MKSVVQEKSEAFSVRIIRLYQYLKGQKHETVMSNQLLRSGTSIGANVNEALNGISRKDFLAKMYIAFKECRETDYWLKMLHRTNYITDVEYNSISVDCIELLKILGSITKTTSQTL